MKIKEMGMKSKMKIAKPKMAMPKVKGPKMEGPDMGMSGVGKDHMERIASVRAMGSMKGY